MASTSANSPPATTRKGKQAKQNYIAQRIGIPGTPDNLI